ncbi:transmembrane protein 53-like [Anneissia japonica]|uniref:transmembrane protein 53-like n=1 Tax=Anneissia japonica TaxID=1529436 RepID=UPI001425B00C|nr:transmembrane protein 53-like [Anneissia japonica]
MLKTLQLAKNASLFCSKPALIPANRLQLCVCSVSTEANFGLQKTRVDDNILLQKSATSRPGAPLVLMYSWLAAKQRHLDRFSKLYLNKGCDVVYVQIKPLQLLRPTVGSQKIAEKLVGLVQDSGHNDRPLFVHTFSVGAYLHSETLTKMSQHDAMHQTAIVDRIAGQVFDSAVDLDNVPYGTSRALLKNHLAQNSLEWILNAFLKVTYKHTMAHYEKAHKTFFCNPASTPLLFLYSQVDPVAPASTIERCMNILKNDHGKEVHSKSFESSAHVSHMYQYQNEYVAALESFLHNLSCFNDEKPK